MNNNSITLASMENCTGCGACKAICPKGAIVFKPDEEGFPTPQIMEDKCIHCGLCEKTCPALHPPVRRTIMAAYAAQLKDRDALKDSTSGGLFTAFSREIFRRGGAVFGCVWDADYNAVIVQADNEDEIVPMRGSKYVWSNASDAFPRVKAVLDSGRPVLFTGLPCQAAGLKNFLRKDYDNLYIMDCLCSGAPSPLAFQAWIDTIIQPGISKRRLNLKFRDKTPYGVGVHITYNGQRRKPRKPMQVAREHLMNPYYYTFFSRIIDRECCFQCTYGSDQRLSDLTMADYWGVTNYHRDFDALAGVSALMINTLRGQSLFDVVKNDLNYITTQPQQIGKANNLACDGAVRKIYRPPLRDRFIKVAAESGWRTAERRYLLLNKRRLKSIIGSIPIVARLKNRLR